MIDREPAHHVMTLFSGDSRVKIYFVLRPMHAFAVGCHDVTRQGVTFSCDNFHDMSWHVVHNFWPLS